MGHFKIDNEFWVFEIQTDYCGKGYHCGLTYGGPNTCIEFRVDNDTANIFDIQCIYLGDILQETFFRIPDIRSNPELEKMKYPKCYESDDEHKLPCIVNVTRDEMQLIFRGNSFDVYYYYADGRVEFYYDEDMKLLHIKVTDLTEEEYNFLKSGGANGEHFHWN